MFFIVSPVIIILKGDFIPGCIVVGSAKLYSVPTICPFHLNYYSIESISWLGYTLVTNKRILFQFFLDSSSVDRVSSVVATVTYKSSMIDVSVTSILLEYTILVMPIIITVL